MIHFAQSSRLVKTNRQVCIAEVEEIVPVGSLSPEERQIFCFVRDAT